MLKYKLICTSGHAPSYFLERFLASVASQKPSHLYSLSIYLLKQKRKKFGLTQYSCFKTYKLTIYEVPYSLSLSEARNTLLHLSKYEYCDYVLFPDDDCYYPKDFFLDATKIILRLQKHSTSAKNTIFSFPVFDPIEKRFFGRRSCSKPVSINQWNITFMPISVGIIIPFAAFSKCSLRFNTCLGAGTSLSAGEETLLLFQLIFRYSFNCLHLPAPSVFHDLYDPITLDSQKVFSYSKASALLSLFLLVKYKYPGPIIISCIFILSSLLRWALSVNSNPSHSSYYYSRFIGSICGFIGLFHSKQLSAINSQCP